jgi:glutaredoxin
MSTHNDYFILYSKTNCPWCEKAKKLLDQYGLEYNTIEVTSYETTEPGKIELEQFKRMFPGIMSLPHISNAYEADIGNYDRLLVFVTGKYGEKLMATRRKTLLSKLREGEVTVTFTKVSGQPRVMRCTLQPSVLIENVENYNDDMIKDEPGKPIVVWSIENGAFRSFYFDNIKDVVVNGNSIWSQE